MESGDRDRHVAYLARTELLAKPGHQIGAGSIWILQISVGEFKGEFFAAIEINVAIIPAIFLIRQFVDYEKGESEPAINPGLTLLAAQLR